MSPYLHSAVIDEIITAGVTWYQFTLDEQRVAVSAEEIPAPTSTEEVTNQSFANGGTHVAPYIKEGLVFFFGGVWPTTGADEDPVKAFNHAVTDAFVSGTY